MYKYFDNLLLYHYETKNVNKTVKRNIDRFPENFCFQLTKSEMDKMWFQNGTTSKGENNKYRSEKAVNTNLDLSCNKTVI